MPHVLPSLEIVKTALVPQLVRSNGCKSATPRRTRYGVHGAFQMTWCCLSVPNITIEAAEVCSVAPVRAVAKPVLPKSM